jgi:hypothetical protein
MSKRTVACTPIYRNFDETLCPDRLGNVMKEKCSTQISSLEEFYKENLLDSLLVSNYVPGFDIF